MKKQENGLCFWEEALFLMKKSSKICRIYCSLACLQIVHGIQWDSSKERHTFLDQKEKKHCPWFISDVKFTFMLPPFLSFSAV